MTFEELAFLDAYCAWKGKTRTAVIRALIGRLTPPGSADLGALPAEARRAHQAMLHAAALRSETAPRPPTDDEEF